MRPLSAGTFYATDVGSPGNVAANGFGIVLATWTADFPTPGSFLVPLVDGRSIRSVGNTNYARLNDPAVDGLIDQARAAGSADAWREVAGTVDGGLGLRAAGGDPHPAARGPAPPERRRDAAVQRARRRRRRGAY